MPLTEKPENQIRGNPPPIEAFSCRQIDLFQFFLCNTEDQRAELSNAFPLWDCLPRYSMSRQTADRLRKNNNLPPLLSIKCQHLGQKYTLEIQPARILERDGRVIEYFPSSAEEITEDALRKIATLQNQGFYEASKPRSGVSFTIYQLREELKKQGHTKSYKEIVLSLQVLARSIIEIKCEAKKNRAFEVSPYFQRLSSVSRADLIEDPNARWYVEFHPLVTQAINSIDYRQFNYALMMSHTTQLARWLHKYLVIKFTYAQVGKVFEIRYSTVKRDSALLDGFGRNRDATSAMGNALGELQKKGLLLTVKKNIIIGTKGRVEDILFSISPTVQFSAEVRAANKRIDSSKNQLNPGHREEWVA